MIQMQWPLQSMWRGVIILKIDFKDNIRHSIMTKKNIDYSKTIIYKIVCNDLNVKDIYVGSTTDFRKRKYHHKSNCKNENCLKVYQLIRENGGWDNWTMVEIEKYSCQDGNEARSRERHWYEQLEATLNTLSPSTTQAKRKQYQTNRYIKNKDKILKQQSNYRQKHLEEEKQKHAKYRAEHTEEIKEYRAKYKAEHKEELKQKSAKYYAEHAEEIKKYREEHKEEMKQYMKKYREKKKLVKGMA